MRMNIRIGSFFALLLASTSAALAQDAAPPAAQPATAGPPAKEPATREELKAVLEEVRRLKFELGIRDIEYQSYAGMGVAASKVYFAPKGLSIGGYGEFFYRNNLGRTGSDVCAINAGGCDFTDLLRAVVYTGYRFGDKVVFNSEIEFEHESQVFVEFAYLDFLFANPIRLRVGNVLVPMGITNEMHEPVFFNGVERPETERNIIPSTWNENGVGLHGEVLPGLTYKLYALQGLNAAKAPTASNWIRGLRTRGGTTGGSASQRALAETLAGVAALAYQSGPVSVGASVYRGRAGQGQQVSGTDARKIDADVTMYEAHAQLAMRGAQLKALAVQGTITDGDLVNQKHSLTGSSGIGSRVRGAYAEAGFDVLSLARRDDQLVPFVRYELLKFHDEVPAGTTRNPALDVDLVVTGLTYKPLPTIALKADWSWRKTGAANDAVTRAVNVGGAFVF